MKYRAPNNRWDAQFELDYLNNLKDIEADIKDITDRINNLVLNSGTSVIELVDARQDENGVIHTSLKERIDSISGIVNSEIDQLLNKHESLLETARASGIPSNAGKPTFTRAATRVYKGRTYQIDEPVYDRGGILVDPTLSEAFTIPTMNIMNAYEGTIEAEIIPLQLVDTVNYFRIDFPSTGRFLLYVNAAGKISFSIDEWGGKSVDTSDGVAKLNEPFRVAMRWNTKAKAYSLFVNGVKIGTQYYDRAVKGAFGTTMSVIYNYPAIITKLRFSLIARADKELIS